MTSTEVKMPFGKHAGEPLSEIPTSYLLWLRNKADLDNPTLWDDVDEELERRHEEKR